ncbi:MAG: pantoate--beta-alanine ligase [Bryobacteraceae bacterium]
METILTLDGLRMPLGLARFKDKIIGLVPTMGALHHGHEELIRRAVAECHYVAVTLFVNPTQFDRKEDYERYARTFEADQAVAERLGAHLLFAPSAEEMYPRPGLTWVEVDKLGDGLCGKFRPGHFRGVATVVTKLFNLFQPDKAYFGQKDAQQLAIIRRLAADLNFPIEIVAVPTVRELDGLALSSRNQRLTPEGRRLAPLLYKALEAVRAALDAGVRDPAQALAAAAPALQTQTEIIVEYLEIVDSDDLHPLDTIADSALIAVGAWIDGVRLIDNVAWPS